MINNLPIKIDLPSDFLKEEIRCGFKITEKRKAIWAIELDLYNEFRKVCIKHGISFFADGGTVLGAVRHNGFIPWDDDMDIMMTRKDYIRFCNVAPSEFAFPYFWQTDKTDPSSWRGHGQLRNSLTTAIKKSNVIYNIKYNQGIFLDVFPFDNIPDDLAERKRYYDKLNEIKLKSSMIVDLYYDNNYSTGVIKVLKDICKSFIKQSCYNPFYQILENEKKRYIDKDTLYFTNLWKFYPDEPERRAFPRKIYEKNQELDFEFLTVPVPAEYEEYLEILYGNWREWVIGSSDHGDMFFDVNTPYNSYNSDDKKTEILKGLIR